MKPSRKWTKNLQAEMTLEEVAAELGVTRERVRQIENKALEKLEKLIEQAGITPEDLGYEEPARKSQVFAA